jgi:ATP-binding cassette subfamily C protein LapB
VKNFIEYISLYTQLVEKPFSYARLIQDLPLKNGEDNSLSHLNEEEIEPLLHRVANTAGLKATIKENSLENISLLELPVIAYTKDGFCLITQINDDITLLILDDQSTIEKKISKELFEKTFLNKIIVLKKRFIFSEAEDKNFGLGIKHWLFDTLKLSRKIYIDVILASLLINLFVLATPLFTMNVYDRVIPNNAIETLWVFAIGVIVVYLLDSALKFIRTYFLELGAKKSDIVISSLLYEKILNIKMSHIPPSVGLFANHIKGFDQIRGFLTNATLTLIVDLPFALIFLAVIAYIGGTIVLIPIIVMLLILIISIFINNILQKEIDKSHHLYAKKNSILIETLNNLELFKSFGKVGWLKYKWENLNNSLVDQGLKSRILASSISIMTSLLIQLNIVFIVIYGVYEIYDVNLTMGGLIAIIILSSRVVAPMAQLSTLLMNYNDAKSAFERLDTIMHQEDEKIIDKNYIELPDGFNGTIEFKNVSFAYPNTKEPIIKNLSFTINQGEKIAFIGKIGSGKTTILKLLMGYYEPTAGTILYNGIDMKELNPTNLRDSIGYVSQSSSLFQGTLKENLSIKANLSDEQIYQALRLSGIEEFVNNSSLGLSLPIGENGNGLSGGQIQSLCIARALVTKPKILLFDEPTSSLDQLSEMNLLNNLANYTQNKTALYVTQKKSVLDLVDRIIVLENGNIYLDDIKEIVLEKLSKGTK